MKCLNCEKETTNPKFCNRSCAASFNNRTTPKRKRKRICKTEGCTEIVKSYRHDYCEEHWERVRRYKYKNKTVGEYRNRGSVKDKHPSWLNAHVRGFARSWLKHLTELPCAKCGYDLHVELAHIKAVTEFSDEALLTDINNIDNVVQLCPNCHWEFDNLDRENFWEDVDNRESLD